MNRKVWAKIRRKIVDATTGKSVKDWSKWQTNLVFDSALTALATGNINFSTIFASLKVGSSNAPNETVGGTTTFTQIGNTITASASFFTNSMIGGIFKYGAVGTSAGAEQYVTAVAGNHLSCTVAGAGMSVGAATAGAVWYVQQTQLTSYLYTSTSYVTAPGDCGVSYSGNQATVLRTYQIGVQASPYSVSELAYSNNSNSDGSCNGRFVLASPDVISPSQFYVVQIAITFALSPSAPTAIANVGTGIDTSGHVMWQNWAFSVVNADGSGATAAMMDASSYGFGLLTTAAPALNATISQSGATNFTLTYKVASGLFSNSTLPVGVATASVAISATTAGETVQSLLFGQNTFQGIMAPFVINLTTPLTLPVGAFTASFTLQRTVTRTLVN